MIDMTVSDVVAVATVLRFNRSGGCGTWPLNRHGRPGRDDKAAHDRQDLRERIFARGKADLDRTRWSRDWPPVSKPLLAERPHNPWREVIREASAGNPPAPFDEAGAGDVA